MKEPFVIYYGVIQKMKMKLGYLIHEELIGCLDIKWQMNLIKLMEMELIFRAHQFAGVGIKIDLKKTI